MILKSNESYAFSSRKLNEKREGKTTTNWFSPLFFIINFSISNLSENHRQALLFFRPPE